MCSLTPVRRGRAALTSLAAVLVVAAGSPAVAAAQAQPLSGWTVRVLPARNVVSQPLHLLDDGTVVGTDYATQVWGEGRPWIWSAATGRRQLGLAGAAWADVGDAPNAVNVVGTLYRTDAAGTVHSTAVRWQGTRPVPLLPNAAGDTIADAASPAGDVAVRERTATTETAWLLSPGRPPTDLEFFPFREWVVSLNSARQAVVQSLGPGTAGPSSFSVWQEGTRHWLDIGGIRDAPACVSDITESGYVSGSRLLFGTGALRGEAVLWRAGTRTVLPDEGLSASAACGASGTNEAGHVVGSLSPPIPRPGEPDPGGGPPRTVMWRDGTVRTIATDTAQEDVGAVGVTDRDVVLAQLRNADRVRTGVAVFADGARRNLRVPAGVTDVAGIDINEQNQVVGSGMRTAADGTTRRVTLVWTPAGRP